MSTNQLFEETKWVKLVQLHCHHKMIKFKGAQHLQHLKLDRSRLRINNIIKPYIVACPLFLINNQHKPYVHVRHSALLPNKQTNTMQNYTYNNVSIHQVCCPFMPSWLLIRDKFNKCISQNVHQGIFSPIAVQPPWEEQHCPSHQKSLCH